MPPERVDRLLDASPSSLLERLEALRGAGLQRDRARRAELGQFFTPSSVARFMAGLLEGGAEDVRLLDPGAGTGMLTAAATIELLGRRRAPRTIAVSAFEVDPKLKGALRSTMAACDSLCGAAGVAFTTDTSGTDFIASAAAAARDEARGGLGRWNVVILNPPYRKIRADSPPRRLLRELGIEAGNLYAGFLALAADLLEPDGELVAITPRSFCNGPYFRAFRERFLSTMTLRRLHVFEARDRVFGDDGVLQENVVIHAVKRPAGEHARVVLSASDTPGAEMRSVRAVPYGSVVRPDDPDGFIRLVLDDAGDRVAEVMSRLGRSLGDLGVAVSTGRVVEFRSRSHLRARRGDGDAPLVRPSHVVGGRVEWPARSKRRGQRPNQGSDGRRANEKPNAISVCAETDALLLPAGDYTLVKRFTAKEEARRVVAARYDPGLVPGDRVGFENHLNVFHAHGGGLRPGLAAGLALFLNSTFVDLYIRQWSGHTQVNAADLRSLRYPTLRQLLAIARSVGEGAPDQARIDQAVERVIARAAL